MKDKLLLITLTTTLLLGCSSTGSKLADSSKNGARSEPKSWFCEGKSEGALVSAFKGWDCSQLTKQEIAQRTAEREQQQAERAERKRAAEQLAAREESARDPEATETQSTATRKFLAIDAKTPLYISLAYKPEQPTSLLDLPKTFWAIQIMALQDQDGLNNYVLDKQLVGVSGAKIESQGKLFYALLLGVYESRSIAEEAWESRPKSISALKPYFRDLGSLQNAIRDGANL